MKQMLKRSILVLSLFAFISSGNLAFAGTHRHHRHHGRDVVYVRGVTSRYYAGPAYRQSYVRSYYPGSYYGSRAYYSPRYYNSGYYDSGYGCYSRPYGYPYYNSGYYNRPYYGGSGVTFSFGGGF